MWKECCPTRRWCSYVQLYCDGLRMLIVIRPVKVQWSLYVPRSGHYMYRQFNIQQFYVLPTQCVYVFCVDLRTNSDYFPMQHQLFGFYNRDENFYCAVRTEHLIKVKLSNVNITVLSL
jgi:hypothetical protein